MLPDSAWIDSIQIFVVDSSSIRDVNVYMKYYYPLTVLSAGLGIQVNTSGAPGFATLNALTSPLYTNNSQFAYSVYVSWISPSDPEPTSAIRVGATKIWYRK